MAWARAPLKVKNWSSAIVELAFTLLISRYAFRERARPVEIIGLAMLVISIAAVLNSGR
jgi:hypothetical protein